MSGYAGTDGSYTVTCMHAYTRRANYGSFMTFFRSQVSEDVTSTVVRIRVMSGKRDCMYSMSCKDSERRSVIFEYFLFFSLSVASLGVVLAAEFEMRPAPFTAY